MLAFQTVSQKSQIDRTMHVWFHKGGGVYKCVLCGGISNSPTNSKLPESFERLTGDDRGLCLSKHLVPK